MKRTSLGMMLAAAAAVSMFHASLALARPQFQKQFIAKYLADNDNEEYVLLVKKKVKCFVCHDPTKDEKTGKASKKKRNAYGDELAKLLTKKDKKNIEKIQQALGTVAKMKADPSDPASPTYGERIEQCKLPVDVKIPPKAKKE
ncbi:MAG: hypothetical protein ACC645_11055 [Pirellulales bacterium]